MDGVSVGSQNLPGGVDGRYALGTEALLFATGLSGGESAGPGYVSSIQLISGCVPPQIIARLSGAAASKLPPGNAVIQVSAATSGPSTMTLAWTGSSGPFQLHRSSDATSPVWEPIGGPTTNRSLAISTTSSREFHRVSQTQPDIYVGALPNGKQVVPTKQILWPAGQRVKFGNRGLDLVLSPNGKTTYIKAASSLVMVDTVLWRVIQSLNYPATAASMHGIAVSQDGAHVYVTGGNNELYEWMTLPNNTASFSRTIALPTRSNPCGLALSTNGVSAYVCLSMSNQLAEVNLADGTVNRRINVGIAPYAVVLSPDEQWAYVTDIGGRFPVNGDLTALSAGTPVVVDNRGIGASGAVSFVDLALGVETAQVADRAPPF